VRETAWEEGFSHLIAYVAKHDDSSVPCLYKTECGYNLGQWTATQRRKADSLTKERILRLESLNGWIWNALDAAWEEGFSYLVAYVAKHGDANVLRLYKTEDGYKLGQWTGVQRSKREKLTIERASRLESLSGWVWNTLDAAWEDGFSHLSAFIEQEGHANISSKYKTNDGFNLGGWINRQRNKRAKLTVERELRLESLNGWVWNTLDAAWEDAFSHLSAFIEQEGHANVPNNYKVNDGFNLGSWVRGQRTKKEQLTPEQVSRLESLNGWVWNPFDSAWKEGFSHLVAYVAKYGDANV